MNIEKNIGKCDVFDENNNIIYSLIFSRIALQVKELIYISYFFTKNGTLLFLYKLPHMKNLVEIFDENGNQKINEKLVFYREKEEKKHEILYSQSNLIYMLNLSSFEICRQYTSILDVFGYDNEVKEYKGAIKYIYSPIKNNNGNYLVNLIEYNDSVTVLSLKYDIKIEYL